MKSIGTTQIKQMTAEQAGQVLQEHSQPTQQRLASLKIGRDVTSEAERVTDSSIEDVFLEITQLFEGDKTLPEAVEFTLDLAMRNVEAESGSVMFANETGLQLFFAAARGPKATELLTRDFMVPISQGIVGFATRNGVTVAVSEAGNDPRFKRDIADAIDYPVTSIACAPIQCEGQAYGAIELMNHKARSRFVTPETNILTYLGRQLGRFVNSKM